MKKRMSDSLQNGINLQPVMSLMVVLVPILLVSAEFSKINIIKVSQKNGASGITQLPKQPTREKQLTVALTDSSLTILTETRIFPSFVYHTVSQNDKGIDDCKYLLYDSGDRTRDTTSETLKLFEEFGTLLVHVRESFGVHTNDITIACSEHVPYNTIIKTMDAVREAGFSDVGLAKLAN